MKAVIILAHPGRQSLNASIARACVDSLKAQGRTVELRDLYALDFDPRLKAEEIVGTKSHPVLPDVAEERRILSGADLYVFVYPLWFNGPPAILKGYVDRVFGMGFGFEPVFGGTEPMLGGKRLLSFTTSGAPDHWVRETHVMNDLQRLFDHHVCLTTGMTLVDHVHFGGVIQGIRPDVVDEMLMRVDQIIRHINEPADA